MLDRTKEPGALGEPLYLDVVAALSESMDAVHPPFERIPRVIGGRYGLSSKEFTPAMVTATLNELKSERPKRHFTVGIHDDVSHLSLPVETNVIDRPAGEVQAMFFGLGADGTVGANKSSVKIIGENTDLWAQGYFVYDSKKSGSVTVSHLRFGPEPIRSSYLIEEADFVACHQFGLLERMKVLERARQGSLFLLNSPYGPNEVWTHLPYSVRQQIVAKDIDLWVIDAYKVARESELGGRINTVMQTCFFHLSGVLPSLGGDRPYQGLDREDLRKTRAHDRRAEFRSRRSIDRRTSACRHSQHSRSGGLVTVSRPRGCAGLRHQGHRATDGGRRRFASCECFSRGRNLSSWNGEVREAVDCQGDPHMGSGHLHRLREVRDRLPSRDDSHEDLRAGLSR